MNPQLERIEIQPIVLDDDNFPVQNTLIGQRHVQRTDQLREVTVKGSLITALEVNVVVIAKHDRTKAVPLGFEDPPFAWRQDSNTLCKHRLNRRVDRQIHLSSVPLIFSTI